MQMLFTTQSYIFTTQLRRGTCHGFSARRETEFMRREGEFGRQRSHAMHLASGLAFAIILVDTGRRLEVGGVDIEVAFTGIRPGEKLYEELALEAEEAKRTRHPKILIGQVRRADQGLVPWGLSQLRQAIRDQDRQKLLYLMGRLVPEANLGAMGRVVGEITDSRRVRWERRTPPGGVQIG